MKRKIIATIMALLMCAAVVPATGIFRVMAENEEALQAEEPDYAALSGVWKSENTKTEEMLTLSADGLFVYHTREGGDVQGYLEYVDEYNDGNGRYDMYNRIGIWLQGFYLDSEDSLHMGNGEETVYTKVGENPADETGESKDSQNKSEDSAKKKSYVLMSNKRYTGLRPLYNNSSWEGGYFYSDMTEDCMTVIVNCSALNDSEFTGTPEEYMEQFAAFVSETDIKDFTAIQNQEYTEKFTYPAYQLEFTTGFNEDSCKWKMLYFQTDTNTFAYAYQVAADFADEMNEEYQDAVSTLELVEIEEAENTGNTVAQEDYDPSAQGQSLEMFIAYFDNWYQYGDLNATSIRLYGEGNWEIYNSRNEDGTGGYLFDSGTFVTLGTTALKLISDSETYVADVTLDANGELLLCPVISGYGNIYPSAAFCRESDSVAYEAQPTGEDEGRGEYIPDGEEADDYISEEDGRGDYILGEDYVEESDPGDTYYWYDGEGNVMYFDGLDSYYIGPDDVFYIDDAGRLCEY